MDRIYNSKIAEKTFKKACIVFIIIFLFFTATYCILNNGKTKEEIAFNTTEECIENKVSQYIENLPDKKEHYLYSKIIYSYENDLQYIEIFNSPDTTVWIYILNKINNEGKIMYKYDYSETIMLYEKWKDVKNYKYKIVDSKEEVNDYKNEITKTTKITYSQYGKKYTKYLLFFDKNKAS